MNWNLAVHKLIIFKYCMAKLKAFQFCSFESSSTAVVIIIATSNLKPDNSAGKGPFFSSLPAEPCAIIELSKKV